MLVRAINTLTTKAEHCEIAAYTLFRAKANMRILACSAIATSSIVGEVNADENALWSRVVREGAGAVGQGTFVAHEFGTDRNLLWIVLEAAFKTVQTDT